MIKTTYVHGIVLAVSGLDIIKSICSISYIAD